MIDLRCGHRTGDSQACERERDHDARQHELGSAPDRDPRIEHSPHRPGDGEHSTGAEDEPWLRAHRDVVDLARVELVVHVEQLTKNDQRCDDDERPGENQAEPLAREEKSEDHGNRHQEQPGAALPEYREVDEESGCGEPECSDRRVEPRARCQVERRPGS